MGQAVTFAGVPAAKKKGAHGRGLADANGAHGRGNIGHCIIDGKACRTVRPFLYHLALYKIHNVALPGGWKHEPAVTEPPGELIYKWIGFWGLSASRKSSWATIDADMVSSTSPFRHIMRSWGDWSVCSRFGGGLVCVTLELVPLEVWRRYHL